MDDADLAHFAVDLHPAASAAGVRVRRIPWSWPDLTETHRDALSRLVDAYVIHYNCTHATGGDDAVPPCWRLHPGLADELAVLLWQWHSAYVDPAASLLAAADYVGRHVPGFASRLDRHLGRSPIECRAGEHPARWRSSDARS